MVTKFLLRTPIRKSLMSMNFFQLVFCIFGFLSFIAQASAAVNQLIFRNISQADQRVICESRIAEIAASFAKQTGVNVLSIRCDKDFQIDNFKGILSYISTKEVPIWDNFDSSYASTYPMFYEKADCEVGLAKEVELVKELTGLNPFAAYCSLRSLSGRSAYRTTIVASGETTVKRNDEYVDLINKPLDFNRVVNELIMQSSKIRIHPTQWNLVREVGGYLMVAGFYENSNDRTVHEIGSRTSLAFTSEAQCEIERKKVELHWDFRLKPVVFSCGKLLNQSSQLTFIWWGGQYARSEITVELLPNDYPNIAQCESDAKKIKAILANQGQKVLGSVCGYASNDYKNIRLEILIF
jgi:hypothetical protein